MKRKKKKVLRPHIILCTEGRLFTLLFIVFPLFALYMMLRGFFISGDNGFIPLIVIFLSIMGFFSTFILNYFWQQAWGKLILEEDKIVWRCLFRRKIEIKYTDIKRVVTRDFGSRNVVKVDVYKTGFQWLLISTDYGLPSKPIDKIKCKEGLIKWRNSDKVCRAMREFFPDRFRSVFYK